MCSNSRTRGALRQHFNDVLGLASNVKVLLRLSIARVHMTKRKVKWWLVVWGAPLGSNLFLDPVQRRRVKLLYLSFSVIDSKNHGLIVAYVDDIMRNQTRDASHDVPKFVMSMSNNVLSPVISLKPIYSCVHSLSFLYAVSFLA